MVAPRSGPASSPTPNLPTTGVGELWTVASRQQRLGEQRGALEILLDAGLRGCTAATLLAHGFRFNMLADLVRDGLASAVPERVRAGGKEIVVARVRITDAGRNALAAEG
jgi:hypothetical protein